MTHEDALAIIKMLGEIEHGLDCIFFVIVLIGLFKRMH